MDNVKKRILVTGGLGFIGSHLVDRLIEKDYQVDVVDNLSTGKIENINNLASTSITDVKTFCETNNVKYDKIYHLANNARIARSFDFVEETLVNNYVSTVSLCEYIRKTQSGHLFFASSSTTEFTDRYNNPYTFSKFACDDLLEMYRRLFNLQSSLVKFYNVYGSMREKDIGEHTTVIRKFKTQYLNKQPLTIVGDGSRKRDFTSIEDTVDGLILLVNKNNYETEYHLGTGNNVSILDVAKAFDHPYIHIEDRKYELQDTICTKQNLAGWSPRDKVIDHVKLWRKQNATS